MGDFQSELCMNLNDVNVGEGNEKIKNVICHHRLIGRIKIR